MILKTKKQKTLLNKIFAIILFILVSLLTIYIGFQISWIIRGPVIHITSPQENALLSQGVITLVGSSKRSTQILVNDYVVPIDTHGFFAVDELLLPGLNTFSITATNKYKKTTTKNVTFWGTKDELIVSDTDPSVETSEDTTKSALSEEVTETPVNKEVVQPENN